jgi:hypothetical protein
LFDYTEEQRKWITDSYFSRMKPFGIDWKIPQNLHFDGEKSKFMNVVDQGLHRFIDFECKAGITRLYVEPDGRIKRCSKGVGGYLGNILTGDYVLPESTVKCNREYCTCKLDAVIEKWK